MSQRFLKSAKAGKTWEPVVYYTGLCFGDIKLRENKVVHSELTDFFEKIEIAKEIITHVWAYKQALNSFVIRFSKYAHFFLIVKTERRYWRIEKMDNGVYVETSENLEALLNPSAKPKKVPGQTAATISKFGTTVLDLFIWIKKRNILQVEYNLLEANCIHFAKDLYTWLQEEGHDVLEEMVVLMKTIS